MKVSPAQQSVIDAMRSGWELSHHEGIRQGWYALQKGGTGRGGEFKRVLSTTVCAMRNKGLIAVKERRFPNTIFILTDLAKGERHEREERI